MQIAEVHVSPYGQTSGLASKQYSGYRITIAVTPKLWNGDGHRNVKTSWTQGQDHLFLQVPENTKIQIRCESDEQHNLVMQLCRASSSNSKQDGPLMNAINPNVDDEYQPYKHDDSKIEATISLAVLYSMINSDEVFDFLSTGKSNPLLRIFLFKKYVDELYSVRDSLRPEYIEKKEKSSIIRGRISTQGLLHHMSTKSLSVESVYDDFTVQTPLQQVLITALHAVRGDASQLAFVGQDTSLKMKKLLTQFQHIRPLPIGSARRISGLVRPNKLGKNKLTTVLSLAKRILRFEDALLSGDDDVGGTMFSINTSKQIWENLIRQRLRESPNIEYDSVVTATEDPWIGLNSGFDKTNPDFLFTHGDDFFCWDAKYKLGSIDRSDQYQMYAYSHLASIANNIPIYPSSIALVYPSQAISRVEIASTHARGPTSQNSNIKLSIIRAPFPSLEDVNNERAWSKYCSNLTRGLQYICATLTEK
jgi:5-methylcytosine-specific restriction endonuclease McrBC regulatory subunit McrC